MRIGILGCGYVGKAIALEWKNQGHHIAATTRSKENIPQLDNFVDEVYLLNGNSLSSFVEKQEVLVIAIAPDLGADYASTYLQIAEQVALAAKSAPSLRQIIYTSSTSVYGDRNGEWVDEETVIIHQDQNRKILHQTEHILLSCQSENLNVCILRLGEIYGPGREIEARLRRMESQPFAGTGESYTNLIHLEDIVNAIDFVFIHHLRGIYNLCSDFHIPRRQFYEHICEHEQIAPIQWDPSRQSAHGGNRRVSNQKIKDAGLTFRHPQYYLQSQKTSL